MGFADSKHNKKLPVHVIRENITLETPVRIFAMFTSTVLFRLISTKKNVFSVFFFMTKKGLLSTQYVVSENII